jgi:hypothetical protein
MNRHANDRSLCEKCYRSTYCTKLVPCGEFALAVGSNFVMEPISINEDRRSLLEVVA